MAKKRPAGSVRFEQRRGRQQTIQAKKPGFNLKPFAFALWIFGVTLIAYLPSLNGKPVWDDDVHMTRPWLQSLHGLWMIWFQLGATQQYYPLLHSAFWLEHRLWGDAVFGYHLINVLLHATSACLVVLIARRLKLAGAVLAGFIFALHPICVEAVAWISEQKSTLSAVFCLAAALVYLHFDETRRRWQYVLAFVLFVLALLSKTVTATLPAALLVIFWWRRGRLEWKRDVLPLTPWLALGAAAGLFTAWVERHFIGAEGADYALTFLQRLLLAGRALWFYAAKVVWPANLTFSYARWNLDPREWWQYLFPVGVIAVAAVFCLFARRNRGPLASFLIFAGTLFPVLGFLNVYPFAYSWVADHFEYLASLAIIIPLSAVLANEAPQLLPARNAQWAVAGAALLLLGGLTWRQSGFYLDAQTLYSETLARNPSSYMAHNNLGNLLLQTPGGLPDAMREYQAALRVRPDSAEAHNNLGNALVQNPARVNEAIAQYRAAVRIRPGYVEAHDNLGAALAQNGQLAEAVSEFETALRLKPDDAQGHVNLGTALSRMPDRLPDAIAEYEKALRLDPSLEAAHFNLADAFSKTPGRLDDAAAEYGAALQLRPDDVEARVRLGNVLLQMPGHTGEAIDEYQTALRMRPDYAPARQMLERLQRAQ